MRAVKLKTHMVEGDGWQEFDYLWQESNHFILVCVSKYGNSHDLRFECWIDVLDEDGIHRHDTREGSYETRCVAHYVTNKISREQWRRWRKDPYLILTEMIL